jgi:hypothetical protein
MLHFRTAGISSSTTECLVFRHSFEIMLRYTEIIYIYICCSQQITEIIGFMQYYIYPQFKIIWILLQKDIEKKGLLHILCIIPRSGVKFNVFY